MRAHAGRQGSRAQGDGGPRRLGGGWRASGAVTEHADDGPRLSGRFRQALLGCRTSLYSDTLPPIEDLSSMQPSAHLIMAVTKLPHGASVSSGCQAVPWRRVLTHVSTQ